MVIFILYRVRRMQILKQAEPLVFDLCAFVSLIQKVEFLLPPISIHTPYMDMYASCLGRCVYIFTLSGWVGVYLYL